MKNPFELIYQNAITENTPGAVNLQPVEYEIDGIRVAANLYLPANFDPKKQYAGITVAHPNGGCKEQVAGLFAQKLAEAGFVAIAADSRYQGASAGEPRLRDYPSNRIGDIHGMVDYLIRLDYVDNNQIGALGICGGGGYTLACAAADKRIKAVATLSMFNSGRVRRNSFGDKDIAGAQGRLERAAAARNKALLGGEVEYESFLPPHKDDDELRQIMEAMPENTLYRDGIEYYGLSHRHPRATSSYTTESFIELIPFDVEDHIDLLTQPLLMIAGEKADTLYMTQDVFGKASNAVSKDIFLVPGASHIRTYWVPEYVKQEIDQLTKFYTKHLHGAKKAH